MTVIWQGRCFEVVRMPWVDATDPDIIELEANMQARLREIEAEALIEAERAKPATEQAST